MSHYLHIHDHIGSINTPIFMVVEFLLGAIPWAKDIFITKISLDNFYPNKNKQKQIAKETKKSTANMTIIVHCQDIRLVTFSLPFKMSTCSTYKNKK
jgi:hypothetical protein